MSNFETFCQYYCAPSGSVVAIDYSRMGFDDAFLSRMEPTMAKAFASMDALEGGAIANPDENRMVGHYWLRKLDLIPDAALRDEVTKDTEAVYTLVKDILSGKIVAPNGKSYDKVLSIGIGGSALGPQLVVDALTDSTSQKLKPFFLDNTDPDGMQRVLDEIGRDGLATTLALVISKSGGTPETRNGMLVAEEAFRDAGLDFGKQAIAVTGVDSKLDNYAKENGWVARVPMYDWVGGRTSVMSAVGLVPCGLVGVDLKGFLKGAADMDAATRNPVTRENPAAILALCWYHATNGKGEKDMVVLPYKDRLLLFSKYLQQLVMESLGKEHDLDGNVVEQGIAVYGNKGSTDQHAYVQQLRDGVSNFFAVFVEVLRDGGNSGLEVEPGFTSGDYLSGFYQGTRQALTEKGRPNMTLTIEAVTPETLGALIALFERAVGLYAAMVNINAYHQPGVEAGKKAATVVLGDQKKLVESLGKEPGVAKSASDWAVPLGLDPEQAFKILQHMSYNNRSVVMQGRTPAEAKFLNQA